MFAAGCGGGSTAQISPNQPGAGGSSYATGAAVSCDSAPDFDSIPSTPATDGTYFEGRNGAVEIWLFTGGC